MGAKAMKIRIKGNSIRLRLARLEVAALARSASIVERTAFDLGQSLTFTLRPSRDSRAISASCRDGAVTVHIPEAKARAWASGDEVGLSAEHPCGDGETLSILIEKDFQCLHGGAAPDPDAYPHPAEV
jgi:hypothetical protein